MAESHARIYPIATGDLAPFDKIIDRVPSIHN